MSFTPLSLLLEQFSHSPFFMPENSAALTAMQELVTTEPRCFERDCFPAHFTGSAFILNHEGTHTLLTHHRKLNKWFQLGGHADGHHDIAGVALKEAEEESGMIGFEFIVPGIFDIDTHLIPPHKETPEHWHYDVRFALRAPAGATFVVSDESLALAWAPLEKIHDYSSEHNLLRMIEKAKKLI